MIFVSFFYVHTGFRVTNKTEDPSVQDAQQGTDRQKNKQADF